MQEYWEHFEQQVDIVEDNVEDIVEDIVEEDIEMAEHILEGDIVEEEVDKPEFLHMNFAVFLQVLHLHEVAVLFSAFLLF